MSSMSERFYMFAEQECSGSSPLYEHLAEQMAGDDDILQLAEQAPDGQPVPNLLFGAVHYLLMGERDHPLQSFYPTFTNHPKPKERAYPVFRSYVFTNKQAVQKLIREKRVQTNEVRRCAYLYPVFCHIAVRTNRPLGLIEIGTSAGLQLLVDRYSYSYGRDTIYGCARSQLYLNSEVRHGKLPGFMHQPPVIKEKIGVDLHVCDVTHEETMLWLKALIWPEHNQRREHLEQAVQELRLNPPDFYEGDGVEVLPELARRIPEDQALCIFHTHVANQMPVEVKTRLHERLVEISGTRQVFHIYNHMNDSDLHMDVYEDGRIETHTIGATDGHGRWFDWYLEEPVPERTEQ
ncbi:DUF2332 family protein [Halobacillus halophilus]|uniref:DUF2332 domain-containing protein n=1 Tax=Halobacillus halophilus TaxID=1570 RepID=UPI00136AB26D|nr:DUF2332 domain-containing protein [Halobacillus halophilus]MYL31618.1 DUF2332 family protein [Halobacillus halophilus]